MAILKADEASREPPLEKVSRGKVQRQSLKTYKYLTCLGSPCQVLDAMSEDTAAASIYQQ